MSPLSTAQPARPITGLSISILNFSISIMAAATLDFLKYHRLQSLISKGRRRLVIRD